MAQSNPALSSHYDSPLAPGQVINGTFVLGARLGVGGSTEVFSASHQRTGDTYALKILRTDHLHWHARLMREFELLREVSDPALIRCHGRDVVEVVHEGQTVGLPFLVLDECQQSLRDYLRRRTQESPTRIGRAVPVHRSRILFAPVLELLDELRKHAMVHRDISAQNLVLTKNGSLQLIDFNLGKMAGQERLTGQRVGGGTGRFASPEQRANLAEATPAADIYGIAVCMIEALLGQHIGVYTHAGSIDRGALQRTMAGEASPAGPFGPGDRFPIPSVLAQSLLRAISDNPCERPSPRELLRALESSAAHEPAGETAVLPDKTAAAPSRGIAPPPQSPPLLAPPAREPPTEKASSLLGVVWVRRLSWLCAGALLGAALLRLL